MQQENEKKGYPLPFETTARVKLYEHILLLFAVAFFTALVFETKGSGPGPFLFRLFFLAIALYVFYNWLFTGVLKKTKLRLTGDRIVYIDTFGKKTAGWSEINRVELFRQLDRSYIGIMLKEEAGGENNPLRQNPFRRLFRRVRKNFFSILIPLSSFPGLDLERLYLTMGECMGPYLEGDDANTESGGMPARRGPQ